jgi:hypothetical protein
MRELHVAVSTCAKCGGHTFERALITPLGEQRTAPVLQCAGCGGVIGMLDSHLTIEGLRKEIAHIDAGLVRIAKALSEQ